jgi:hypothetical protein
MAVKVGPPKTQMGLLKLYNTEMSRIESMFRLESNLARQHSDVSALRKYLHWFMIQLVTYSWSPTVPV